MGGDANNTQASRPRLTKSEIDSLTKELKARINLPNIVSNHGVKLKRSGRDMVGLSPFTNERTPSFFVKARSYHCYSSGQGGDIVDWLQSQGNMSWWEAFQEGLRLAGLEQGPLTKVQVAKRERMDRARDESEAQYRKRMMDYALSIWRGSANADGTLVATYLRARAIDLELIGGIPVCIRFHKGVRNPSGETFPAMVTGIKNQYNLFCGVHVTFLKPDGSWKITPKIVNGKKRIAKQILGSYFGGAARLITPQEDPFADGNHRLAVGEGIESELAAYQIYCENNDGGGMWWAALSLNNLTGAALRDDRGGMIRTTRIKGSDPTGHLRGDPARAGFLPPPGWVQHGNSEILILGEDDLKDDPKRGITGTQRAREAYGLAADKFISTGGVYGVDLAMPPNGQDFNDILIDRAKVAAQTHLMEA